MDYLKYVMIIGSASLCVAAVCCAALWLMAPFILARARHEAPEPEEKAPPVRLPEKTEARVPGLSFDFTVAQAPALAGFLEKESPDDIAVVVSRLPADAGSALLAALPPELRAKTLLSLASPRAVGLDLMRGMKAELENRLYGVVGGTAEAAAFIRPLPYKDRKDLLEKISAQDPARGASLKALFIFDDELADLGEKDLRALAAAVPGEKMGPFLYSLPEKVRIKIKEQYAGKDALALEKAALSGSQGPNEKAAVLGAFMDLTEKLAAKGVITKPKPQAKTAAPAPAAKDDWG